MNLYESMFLLDNQAVRADWKAAKSAVTDLFKKHGAEIVTARRWDERKLAYPIRGHRRATYLLTYTKVPADSVSLVRRDLELDERVLRYLLLRAESVPDQELELSKAELVEGFTVPPPPLDDEPTWTREGEAEAPAGEAAPAVAAPEAAAEETPEEVPEIEEEQ